MSKQYGERNKDDLLNEIESLQDQIEYLTSEDSVKGLRVTALGYASNLHPSVPGDVDTLLQESAKIEKYLSTGQTPVVDPGPSPTPDPVVPVPSPS